MADPTYAELKSLRAAEWQDAQGRLATQLAEAQAAMLASPEITAPASPWDTGGAIPCACGHAVFHVDARRYVTVNGRRHRARLMCVACRAIGVWDFGEHRWLI